MPSANAYRYVQVKQEILRLIQSCPAGSPIPSRAELMERFGVTRTTIDRAISELIGEHHLHSRKGSGTFVAGRGDGLPPPPANVDSWGIIIPNILSDTYPGILRGVEDVCHDLGINLVICNTDYDPEKQDRYIRKLIDSKVRGLIVVPAPVTRESLCSLQMLHEHHVPFVFCCRGIEGVKAPKVVANDYFGGNIATRHLLNLGWKRPAYLGGRLFANSEQRYHGYLSALYEAGLEAAGEYARFGEDKSLQEFACDAMRALLNLPNPPDSVVCFNDKTAQGVYRALQLAGLTAGRDIAVIGYDDTNICETLPVRLSSIKYPKYEIGQKAAGMLMEIIQGKRPSQQAVVVLPPALVARESCGEKIRR